MHRETSASSPHISIIIRTLNEEKNIGNLLKALQEQSHKDFEIIIVDSGSVDKTLEIARQFPVRIKEIESRDFTFGYALNIGCKEAKGECLVFASAHVLPTNNRWLENLIAPFNDERVAMVYGRQFGDPGAKYSEKRDFERLFGGSAFNSKVPLDYANNANAAIRQSLWQEQPFDEYLFGLEDIDWARTMLKRGHLIHYEPQAAIYHIHRESWNQVYNRYRREAIAARAMGLARPPQARPDISMFVANLSADLISAFPHYTSSLVKEIIRFRFEQWKGTYRGWYRDRNVSFAKERQSLFYPASNKAVHINGPSDARFEEISIPELKPGDLLIRVAYVGICRTDLEVYEGTLGYYKEGQARYPIVPGHEFSGTIVKIGANNKYQEKFKIGEAVVGECILSRTEKNRSEVGVINHNGAYSQFVVIPGAFTHKVPAGMDLKVAALAEPLAVVMRALRRVQPRLSSSSKIAIIGAGSIGNLCAQVLSIEGHAVTVFDKEEDRLKHLESVVESTSSTLRDMQKFDLVLEATGSQGVLEQILKESRMDCTLLLLGFPYGDIHYNFEDVVGREKVIVGSVGAGREDFMRALEWLPRLNLDAFIRTTLPLEEFEKAWKYHKTSKDLKILLKP